MTTRTVASPVGPLQLYAGDGALVWIQFPGRPGPRGAGAAVTAHDDVLAQTAAQLADYFAGTRLGFDLPLAPPGTPFQAEVWSALLAIPYGATRTYGELAHALRRPSASRAVGAANGANPISIIVPCHRLVGANGTLTGYGGGLAMKRWLLDHEAGRSGAR